MGMYANNDNLSMKEFRIIESALHKDLTDCCRHYLKELGIVSIIGVIDIVKQETIELEHATKKNIQIHEPEEMSQSIN